MDIENVYQLESNSTWPISPSFLVKSIFSKNEKYTLNKHGVYASDTIRGLIADASDDPNIKNPLSLFQVVPALCEFEEFPYIRKIKPAENDLYLNKILNGKQVVRVDPNVLYIKKTCCDKFRECNGYENKCHEQDCRIALLYHNDLKEIDYHNNFNDYYKRLKEIINEYNNLFTKESPLHCERDEANNNLYVWYKCTYSNFYEYFFPIIHSGKVIAVLMQGQRIPETLKREEIFNSVLNDANVEPGKKEDLYQSINAIQNDEFGKSPMPASRLNAIWKRIHTLEQRVDEEVMSHARAYVSANFYRIENEFRKEIRNEIKEKGGLTNETYKKIVNDTLRKICYVFNKEGFIRIYSTDLEFKEDKSKTDTFYLIGAFPQLTESEKNKWEKLTFHNLPSDVDMLEKMINEDYDTYLEQKIRFHDDVIFRIDSLSIGNTKHLIWKEYPKKKNIDQKQFDEFSKFLKTFYPTIWEPYNLLRSVKLRKNLETSMRVSVHETSQIIPVIINTLKREYRLDSKVLIQEDRLNSSSITRRTNTLYDTIHRLLLLDNLYKRSTLMFKDLIPKMEWTDLHRLIYSIKSLCDEKAKGNNLQYITVKGINDFNFSQYEIYTDYQLVSHALFNLIDNAVKYGYMGSVIKINISLSETDLYYAKTGNFHLINSIQISVVSYGSEVNKEDEKHIYELFYRSQESKVKDGMGIGLFLVRKICNSLGYSVEYKGQKISDYNLPIYHYGLRQGKTLQSIKSVSNNTIEEAVNIGLSGKDWYIEDAEFDASINKPTYRNEFIITLYKTENNLIKRI